MAEDDNLVDPYDPADVAAVEVIRAARVEKSDEDIIHALRSRMESYRRVFGSGATPADTRVVMDDLKKFCRGDLSAFDPNDRVHCMLTGRQEVYLRIKDHIMLSLDDLAEQYTRKPETWK